MKLSNIKSWHIDAYEALHPHHHNLGPIPHHAGGPLIPREREGFHPHLRPDTGRIPFSVEDFELLTIITEDEDTAASVIQFSENVPPPEIQDVIHQLLWICHIVSVFYEPETFKKEYLYESESISRTECGSSHYPAEVLDKKAQEHYRSIYPEYAEKFLEDLSYAPDEISILSRLAVFIEEALRSLINTNRGDDNEDNEHC